MSVVSVLTVHLTRVYSGHVLCLRCLRMVLISEGKSVSPPKMDSLHKKEKNDLTSDLTRDWRQESGFRGQIHTTSDTTTSVWWRMLTYPDVWWRILTYADVCQRILTYMMTYDDACWHMMTYTDVWWRILTYDDVWWRMLTYNDVWWRMLTYDDVWLYYDTCWR